MFMDFSFTGIIQRLELMSILLLPGCRDGRPFPTQLKLFWKITRVLQGQMGDLKPSACPGNACGSPLNAQRAQRPPHGDVEAS